MNVQKLHLIEKHHGAMVKKGFYDCPECNKHKKRMELLPENTRQINRFWFCSVCDNTGINPNINIGQSIMLIVTELSEAVEADRIKRYAYNMDILLLEENKKSFYVWFENFVKDSLEDEITDTYLRLYDLCGYLKITPNIVAGTVNWRTSNTADMIREISIKVLNLNPEYPRDSDFKTNLGHIFLYLDAFCSKKDINIEKHLVAKMKYNKKRENLHGKNY